MFVSWRASRFPTAHWHIMQAEGITRCGLRYGDRGGKVETAMAVRRDRVCLRCITLEARARGIA